MRSTAFVFIVMAIVTSAESSKSFLRRNEIRKAFEFGQVQDFSAKASTRVNILASAAAEIFNLKYKSAYSDAQDKKYQPAKSTPGALGSYLYRELELGHVGLMFNMFTRLTAVSCVGRGQQTERLR